MGNRRSSVSNQPGIRALVALDPNWTRCPRSRGDRVHVRPVVVEQFPPGELGCLAEPGACSVGSMNMLDQTGYTGGSGMFKCIGPDCKGTDGVPQYLYIPFYLQRKGYSSSRSKNRLESNLSRLRASGFVTKGLRVASYSVSHAGRARTHVAWVVRIATHSGRLANHLQHWIESHPPRAVLLYSSVSCCDSGSPDPVRFYHR